MSDVSAKNGLSIIVPTFNEAANVAELIRRIAAQQTSIDVRDAANIEVIFVDDSSDDTPDEIRRVAAQSKLSIFCIHREISTGGLGGAVLVGVAAAQYQRCLVMDGDLQHPPEIIPALVRQLNTSGKQLVLASRYAGGGNAGGLASALRHSISRSSTLLVKMIFPRRLAGCSDPLTGFFVFERDSIDLHTLRGQGFKILLEILLTQRVSFAEVPFEFATRFAEQSKISLQQGTQFFKQLMRLRFAPRSNKHVVGTL